MAHIVLLGDSIFDNARYVPDRPPVIEQVRRSLPVGWRASLLAVDGHVVLDVIDQLSELPSDATHLFVSAGGNDALSASFMLNDPCGTIADALERLRDTQDNFRQEYVRMLEALHAVQKPVAVCTVYDSLPNDWKTACTALALFNDVIFREAIRTGLPVIDLRLICTRPEDYSDLSPIEPSASGGSKIARTIVEVALRHDFSSRRSMIYW